MSSLIRRVTRRQTNTKQVKFNSFVSISNEYFQALKKSSKDNILLALNEQLITQPNIYTKKPEIGDDNKKTDVPLEKKDQQIQTENQLVTFDDYQNLKEFFKTKLAAKKEKHTRKYNKLKEELEKFKSHDQNKENYPNYRCDNNKPEKPEKIYFVYSIRGSNIMVHNNYQFRKRRTFDDTSYWYCLQKNCLARIIFNDGIVKSVSNHNHPASIDKLQRRRKSNSSQDLEN